MVQLILGLMKQNDFSIKLNAAKVFRSISKKKKVLPELIKNEDLESIVGNTLKVMGGRGCPERELERSENAVP